MSLTSDGVALRAARPEDAESAAAVLALDETAALGQSRIGTADVAAWWRNVDLERDSWLFEEAGLPVAVGWLQTLDTVGAAAGAVHPDAVERGLGQRLVEAVETRAREVQLAKIHQEAYARSAAACELFLRNGYREVMRAYEMGIQMEAMPAEPVVPAGFAIEEFAEHHAHEFHATLLEGFADDLTFEPTAFADWWASLTSAPDFDSTLWFVAVHGSDVAAVIRCEANRRSGGWVGALAVRPPWRRRGLGMALLQRSFREFHARGVRWVGLGVDAASPTGATALYERAGMSVELEEILFEKEIYSRSTSQSPL